MSDDTYQASSPAVRIPSPTGSYISLALDHEPSQNDQWVREEHEALLSKEERAAGALARHRKRQRRGYSPLTSPIKEEEPAPLRTPRSTVEVTNHALKYVSARFTFGIGTDEFQSALCERRVSGLPNRRWHLRGQSI
ncbi:hypothetical protein DFH09DRAFT_1073352 [Mycena vulgaris]|nr:hypothetical protein DFH09DRAFT_1073352 [Mycena vulgaris]